MLGDLLKNLFESALRLFESFPRVLEGVDKVVVTVKYLE
jgi:hypothetical protein